MSVTAHNAKVKAADIFYLISHTNFIYQVGGKGLEMKWNFSLYNSKYQRNEYQQIIS